MTEPATPLRDLVIRRLIELGSDGQPLAYKQAALRSGGRISHETLRRIATGRLSGRGMSDDKIEGVASALGVPYAQVYDAARVPRPGARWRWPERFDRLTEHERRIVEAVAAGFLAAYERGQANAE